MYNPYLGNYGECFPSTNAGYNNYLSTCPSNGTSDLAESNPANPGYPNAYQNSTSDYSIPAGWNPFPYPTTLETGASAYLVGGVVNPANASGEATALAMSDSNVKTPYTQSYNLTVERQITKNMVGTVGYVGNNSRHTYAGTSPMSPIVMTSPNDSTGIYSFPGLGIYAHDQQWIGVSEYNSLQAKLEQRFSYGLAFLATYTWSHALDDAGNPGIGVGPPFRNTNLIPLKDEFTNANYDIRHRITFNGSYDLPFGKGRAYVNQGGVLDYLVGGWSTSATWTAQTGIPFTVTSGNVFVPANGFNEINAIKIGNPFAGGGTPPAANVDMTGNTCPAKVHNRQNWFNPCAFIDPSLNRYESRRISTNRPASRLVHCRSVLPTPSRFPAQKQPRSMGRDGSVSTCPCSRTSKPGAQSTSSSVPTPSTFSTLPPTASQPVPLLVRLPV